MSVTWRRAGPDTCPQAIADMLQQCLDRNPGALTCQVQVMACAYIPASETPRPRALLARPHHQHAASRVADSRPTAGEIAALLAQPVSQLPQALRPRCGSRTFAGAPVCGLGGCW